MTRRNRSSAGAAGRRATACVAALLLGLGVVPGRAADAPQTVLDLANGLFGLHRFALDGSQQIIGLFNCSQKPVQINLEVLPEDIRHWQELIGEVSTEFRAGSLVMPPYAAFWFSNRSQA